MCWHVSGPIYWRKCSSLLLISRKSDFAKADLKPLHHPFLSFLAEVEWGTWLEGSRSAIVWGDLSKVLNVALFPEEVSRAGASALQTHTPLVCVVSGLDRDLGRRYQPICLSCPLSHPLPAPPLPPLSSPHSPSFPSSSSFFFFSSPLPFSLLFGLRPN